MIARLARRLRAWTRPHLRYRFESFGGIVAAEQPPLLLTLSRAGMADLGLDGGHAWSTPDPGAPAESVPSVAPRLSAPVEAHLALTNRCTAGCAHCYMSSGDPLDGEMGRDAMLALVDRLAAMGVFHVALGGGESFLLPWLFDVANHVRARGMVPNVTTSGLALTEDKAARCTVFGRINVSMDGTDAAGYGELRDAAHFGRADAAVRLLRRHHDAVGINCVVTRQSWDAMEDVVAYAADRGLDEVEFLRLKPAGRGATLYLAHRPTPEQNGALLDKVLDLRRRYAVHIKLDCSFGPMVAAHGVDPERLALFSVLGCEGGDYLIGIDAAGTAHPCSFEKNEGTPAARLQADWSAPETFASYRRYRLEAPEPCASCPHAAVCRGGCRVVARFLTGDPAAPDPECPRVLAHRQARISP